MTKIVKIPEDVRDRIQALQYETDSRKDLLGFMVANDYAIAGESFSTYHEEYQNYFVQYSIAKEEMQKQYLEPAVDGKLLNWNLDFSTCEVTCTYDKKI